MLIHLGEGAKKKLLQLYNTSWKNGIIPDIWKKAVVIPIKKEGKPGNRPESYRPISLTSCICKLMERIVNARLMWYLENNHLIADEQAGFRQCRSTEDQITYIAQAIEDAFQEEKKTTVVWIDMEKAFDRIWREGLLLKLRQSNITDNMLDWIQSYLSRRKARVSLHGIKSKEASLKHGVPQGGVLSPTLFLLFVNDIKKTLCKDVKLSMYADDIALMSSASSTGAAKQRLQITLDRLQTWTEDWFMKINARKTTYTVFSLSPKPDNIKLTIGDHRLEKDESPRYLGVHFDKRLTWKNQIDERQKKGMK